jgi:hypothetical protein
VAVAADPEVLHDDERPGPRARLGVALRDNPQDLPGLGMALVFRNERVQRCA